MPVSPSFAQIRPGLLARHQRTSPGVVASTLCYLFIAQGEVTIVDPGEDGDDNWALLSETLAAAGCEPRDIRAVVVTHLHADHLGMAERVRAASGAEILMHRVEQQAIDSRYGGSSTERVDRWGVPASRREEIERVIRTRAERPRTQADRVLDDGETIRLGDYDARVLWTPGHTTGSICLDLLDEGLVLTGDHILPTMYPGIGLGGDSAGNPLDDYLASLERIEALGERQGLPGHGHPFDDVAARSRETIAHHLRRGEDVARTLDGVDRPTVWELAARLHWSAGWDGLHGYALDSALAQTEMHVARLGRAEELARPPRTPAAGSGTAPSAPVAREPVREPWSETELAERRSSDERQRVGAADARSWLLLSALRDADFDRAQLSRADQLVLDLEDAVDASLKPGARERVVAWLRGGGRAWVRINDGSTDAWADDLAALAGAPGLLGVMLAKTELPEHVTETSARLGVPVVPLIESALGVEDAVRIARAPGAFRLAFGSGDYRRDTGAANDPLAMAYPRSRLVVASRIGGLPGPIDGPTVGSTHPVLREQAGESVALGMTGKLCLDLEQPAVINEVMAPSPADLAWAIDFLAEFEAAGAVVRDGSDKPRLARAELIRRRARTFGITAG